jgi:DNA-binding protein HU-beta
MNKSALVARIAKDSGLSKADANRAIDSLVASVTRSLRKGEKVTLVGFGTFLVTRRRARNGHNPRTGAPMRIAACRMPRFAAGKDLKAALR